MSILRPLSFLLSESEAKIALIVLNRPLDLPLVTRLWKNSVFRAAADGGIEELYKSLSNQGEDFLPDVISGDFDSAGSDTLDYYRNKNVEVVPTPDQDETDFTKCVRVVCERMDASQITHIVALGGFGGRIDHSLACINTLYTAKQVTDKPLLLITRTSVACLLDKGEHTLHCDTGLEGDWCGLIPVGQPADRVTTTGLKYNLNNEGMYFGGLISTSNSLDGQTVTVSTDQPLLWTMGYDLDLD